MMDSDPNVTTPKPDSIHGTAFANLAEARPSRSRFRAREP